MPIKPPPPTSPSHALHHQQTGIRSPLPLKQYAQTTSPTSDSGRVGGAPLQQNNAVTNNSQHQQQNSSTHNSINTSQHSPSSSVNNNQFRTNQTGNCNTPPSSRMSLAFAGCGNKRDISPTRVRQSTPSPKTERFSNMNTGDRKQLSCPKASLNEINARQGSISGKQKSPNTNSPNYQNKSVTNSNNGSGDQQPTLKRPRKGSGGVHSKQQQSQQTSHLGTTHVDNVSK